MHLNGWGTARNVQQAQYFFSMAAKVGHTLGTYNLAMLHLSRDAASCPVALELLKKVAGAPIANLTPENQTSSLHSPFKH